MVPTGAMVCVPTSLVVVVDSESRTEQPEMVSQCDEVEVLVVTWPAAFVVVAVKKVVVVQASAVLVSHSGSLSVVIWLSGPMVILGHGGREPSILNPGGHLMRLIGGGPGP